MSVIAALTAENMVVGAFNIKLLISEVDFLFFHHDINVAVLHRALYDVSGFFLDVLHEKFTVSICCGVFFIDLLDEILQNMELQCSLAPILRAVFEYDLLTIFVDQRFDVAEEALLAKSVVAF